MKPLAGSHQHDPSQTISQSMGNVVGLTPPVARSTLVLHTTELASTSVMREVLLEAPLTALPQ